MTIKHKSSLQVTVSEDKQLAFDACKFTPKPQRKIGYLLPKVTYLENDVYQLIIYTSLPSMK
jgi:hypothetical protein